MEEQRCPICGGIGYDETGQPCSCQPDPFVLFMREFWSKRQHWRLMKAVEHMTEFFNSWRAK